MTKASWETLRDQHGRIDGLPMDLSDNAILQGLVDLNR